MMNYKELIGDAMVESYGRISVRSDQPSDDDRELIG